MKGEDATLKLLMRNLLTFIIFMVKNESLKLW